MVWANAQARRNDSGNPLSAIVDLKVRRVSEVEVARLRARVLTRDCTTVIAPGGRVSQVARAGRLAYSLSRKFTLGGREDPAFPDLEHPCAAATARATGWPPPYSRPFANSASTGTMVLRTKTCRVVLIWPRDPES